MSARSSSPGISIATFDTAIGRCGIAWGKTGIVGLQLPESSDAALHERLRHRFPGAQEKATVPASVRLLTGRISDLLQGKAVDLSAAGLDMQKVPPFHRRVYDIVLAIPPGKTLTYGEIARQLGVPGAARAVGQALGKNPFPIVVPCHRVLAANGKLGGFSASGGIHTKMRMLSIEGVQGAFLFDSPKIGNRRASPAS
jgi:methylated-DNA-[protein]-cysteine S-methyltransferase